MSDAHNEVEETIELRLRHAINAAINCAIEEFTVTLDRERERLGVSEERVTAMLLDRGHHEWVDFWTEYVEEDSER